ncbi:MAG: PKD domain-containing protein, partial [Bacteroidota bacterium]
MWNPRQTTFSLLVGLMIFFPARLLAQPTANFTADTTQGCSPFSLVVNFQDLSTGGPTSWLWDFGDANNSTSTLQNPTFVYSDPGCYDVTLTVTNGLGSDAQTITCFIEILAPPVPGFSIDFSQGCVPFTACFTDTTSSSNGAITSWSWTLSDGSPSSVQNPCFSFSTAPDTISAILTVSDAAGCAATAVFQDIIIIDEPPVLDFTVDINSACNPPLTVNVTNNTVVNGAGASNYKWYYPGGTSSAGVDSAAGFNVPPILYNNTGQFDITLVAEAANGCSDTLVQTGLVGIGGVVADFAASDSVICLGESIDFTSLSSGGVSSLEWDFGETPGVDATTPNASYTYQAPGTYSVTLRANNAQCGDTIVRNLFIQVQQSPTAAFDVDRDEDCQPGFPFFFTDQSVGATNWDWSFGDGGVDATQNPNHTYANFGSFPVSLIVTNAFGCQDTAFDTLAVAPPNVNFNQDIIEGCAPLTVNFTDQTQSIDSIISWTWDFGDAVNAIPATSTDQNPTVDFTAPGNYDITLIVVTQGGCTDTLVRTNAVRVGAPPSATFTADKDTLCINEDVTFIAVPGNSNWDYEWDFQYVAPGNFVTQSDTAFTTYPDTGTFDVALVVNDNGCRDTVIVQDIIYVSPPRAQYAVSDTVVCGLPQTITIVDSSLGPADVYNWYLNGNLYSTQQTPPPLTINTPGAYVLTQTILNTLTGCTDTFAAVLSGGDPVADFTVDKNVVCKDEPIEFIITSTNFVQQLWYMDWGDPVNNQPFSPASFFYSYPDTGDYSIFLTIVDVFGCRDTVIRDDYIRVNGPYVDFAGDPQGGCLPHPVQFSDSTTFSPGVPGASWAWDFGDGSAIGTAQNPSHVYNSVGFFDVQLIATDAQGCQDSLTQQNYINVTFPSPAFSVVDDSTCAGNQVVFNNTSTGIGLTYLWDFGDGDTSSLPNPTHAYADTGFYDVKLITTDINGCVDSFIVTNAVYIEQFEARFGGDPTVGICPPLNTQFTDSTIGNVVSWNWSFGDGFGVSILQDPAYVYFQPGNFDVSLVATHEDGCQDTLTKPNFVQLAGPNGSFSLDTAVCLGDSVCLTIITQGASALSSIIWKDGFADAVGGLSGLIDTVTVCHLYQTPGDYSPTVIVEDAQGCQVSINTLDSAIVYNPPTAVIQPTDTAGCLPLSVPFVGTSIQGDTAIAAWSWDFGDGDTSSQFIINHTYLGPQDSTYTVQLAVQDFNGCVDTTTTSVITYSGTIAGFVATDTVGCAPIDIGFSDLSTNVPPTGWTWIFGDGDTLSGVAQPTHTYLNDGLYTVQLIVSDGLGCSDTLVKNNYIDLQHPEARIRSNVTQGCNPITVTFYADSSRSRSPIVGYEWCLTETTTNQTVCTPTPVNLDSLEIPFSEPGNYEMRLIITDDLGCSDTSDALILVIDERLIPPPIIMRNVTVEDQNTVRVSWNPYVGTDFSEYALYRIVNGNEVQIATFTGQQDSVYFDNGAVLNTEGQVYCYKVLVKNTCEEFSLLDDTQEHCTINLTTATGIDEISLSWTPYVGYTVGQYEVYRALDYNLNTLVQIAVVPGNVTSFLDQDMFCRDSVTYRVRAVGFGANYQRSYSNISSDAPTHPLPTTGSDIITATVVDDRYVEISWTEYQGYRPDRYLIERSTDGFSWDSLGSVPLGTTSFADSTALVDTASYYYRVFNIDECGDRSAEARYGKTIYLEADLGRTTTDPFVNWTPYEEWPNGVLNYEVQIFNETSGQWEVVDIVPGSESSFIDALSNLNQAEYCYRVVAYEVGGLGATSTSNVKCVILGTKTLNSSFRPSLFGVKAEGAKI